MGGGGPGGGGGRGGTLISPGYGPIRCGRFGVKNSRVVKKVGEKETPLGEKETPLGEKATKLAKNFVGEKKIHRFRGGEATRLPCAVACLLETSEGVKRRVFHAR